MIGRSFAMTTSAVALLALLASQAAAEVRMLDNAARPAVIGLASGEHSTGSSRPEGFRVAGKIGTAITGGAGLARASRNKNDKNDQDAALQDVDADNQSATADSADQEIIGGPFKLPVPGQAGTAASPAPVTAPAASGVAGAAEVAPQPRPAGVEASHPAAASGPVRTIMDRDANSAAAASPAMPAAAGVAAGTAGAAAAMPKASQPLIASGTSATAVGGSCFAGCYTPTSAQIGGAAVRRPERMVPVKESAGLAPSPTLSSAQFSCVAGCGSEQPSTVRRAAADRPSTATEAASSASKQGGGRITVLRGVTRMRAYGVRD